MSKHGKYFLERVEFCPRGRVVGVPTRPPGARWQDFVAYSARLLKLSLPARHP